MAVAEDDEVAHPGWWVVLVDGVAALQVEDGLDDDLVVADPGLDLRDRGGAVPLDPTDSLGVQVFGFDVGLDLAFPERAGVTVEQ